MDFVYRFPVVRGIQAKREYYIAMVPLRMISVLFQSDEEYVFPEFRAQRRLNTGRIPVISKYILDNPNDYVFSALTASIDGEFKFISSSDNVDLGILEVSMEAKFLINDGQHRKAAILEALTQNSSLGSETISIVFFEDYGLKRSQQIFTDLNKHAIKTSNSISELYDSRDDLAVITRDVISKIPFIDMYTDKERDILGKYSSKLFTLNTFYSANKRIVHKCNSNKDRNEFLILFWNLVSENIKQWNELQNKEISKIDLRENYIITQSVVIQSLGRLGNYFFAHPEVDMEKSIVLLKNIDWRRSALSWKLRTIGANGRMITSENAIVLTTNVIKKCLGIPLDDDELFKEDKFLKNIK